MHIVLYANGNASVSADQLEQIIDAALPRSVVETMETYEQLSERVRWLPREMDAVVIAVRDDSRLSKVVALKEFLRNVRIILILPWEERRMIAKSQILAPSYLCYPDRGFKDLTAVLTRIDNRIRKEMSDLTERGILR